MKHRSAPAIACVAMLALAACKPAGNTAGATAPAAEPPTLVPAPAPGDVRATPAERRPQQSYYPFLRRHIGAGVEARVAAAETDLNGDGTAEVLAYINGPTLCGTGGCNLMVLQRQGSDWQVVMNSSVTQLPVRVLDTRRNGWNDLSVGVAGGGAQAGQVRMQFDGRRYPDNPTTQPPIAGGIGTLLIPPTALGDVLP